MKRVFIVVLALAAVVTAACNQKAAPKEEAKPAAAQAQDAKRYHLKGKIVAVKPAANALSIAAEDIPGFMTAMTMDYAVPTAQSLTGLNAGDEITADVVVPADASGAHLENIVVTKKAGA